MLCGHDFERARKLGVAWKKSLCIDAPDVEQEILCLMVADSKFRDPDHAGALYLEVAKRLDCYQITLGGSGGDERDDDQPEIVDQSSVWPGPGDNNGAEAEIDEEFDARLARLDEILALTGSDLAEQHGYSDRWGRRLLEKTKPARIVELITSAAADNKIDLDTVIKLGDKIQVEMEEARRRGRGLKHFAENKKRFGAVLDRLNAMQPGQNRPSVQTGLQLALF